MDQRIEQRGREFVVVNRENAVLYTSHDISDCRRMEPGGSLYWADDTWPELT